MSLSAIPSALRRRIIQRDQNRCQYCMLAQVGQGAVFHVNHVLPRSKGGATDEANLVLQCPHCSLHKSNKTEATDPADGTTAALLNPREQRWANHFALDPDGSCRGVTSVGRVTVKALHMNAPLPRVARMLQIRHGLLTAGGFGPEHS